ncbi:MAG: VCBS repeat-containing protein [Methylobacteriaceae bacterium]|nr:VCBS repeat-containing protein [Methylobacteriaceae bacterium]
MPRCKNRALAPVLSLALLAGASFWSAADAAQIVVINNNAAGVGFNDATAASPVGGNTGTTVGAQRLIAFQFAADHWGQRVASSVPIRVGAQFSALSCTQNSAVLGSAGPNTVFRNFAGAPRANTWYVAAEANALSGSDQDPATDDINANFNSNIGQPGCLQSLGWYYGLDGNNPSGTIDFVAVLIHEMGHGLGFLSLVDLSTGTKFNGFDDTYMVNLEHHGAATPDFPSMTDAQRVAAQIATGNLHWTGANVQAASSFLTAGAVGTHVRMFAPNPIQSGSSVSHWDTVATPDQIMEPSYTSAIHMPNFERPLFRDLGWKMNQPRLDFDGEAKSGILWRNTSTGDTIISLLKGPGIQSAPSIASSTLVTTVPTNWSIGTSGDFNGDGKADILWRNNSTGDVVTFLMNGTSITTSQLLGTIPTVYAVAGSGDFNGDGRSDILWRNTSTGDTIISTLTGTPTSVAIASSTLVTTIPTAWAVGGVGDFNGDGKADIVWRNTSTGDVVVFLMNGTTITSSVLVGNVPLAWTLAGTGDFNGDGKADLLWRNGTTGDVAVSIMNGASIASTAIIGNIPQTWSVAEVGHFSNDGKASILWRDAAGNNVASLTNGSTITSSTWLGNVPAVYTVQGANGN